MYDDESTAGCTISVEQTLPAQIQISNASNNHADKIPVFSAQTFAPKKRGKGRSDALSNPVQRKFMKAAKMRKELENVMHNKTGKAGFRPNTKQVQPMIPALK